MRNCLIQKEYLTEVGLRKKVEANLDKVILKLQEMEENGSRQEAWRAMKEKHVSWETKKHKLIEMIK